MSLPTKPTNRSTDKPVTENRRLITDNWAFILKSLLAFSIFYLLLNVFQYSVNNANAAISNASRIIPFQGTLTNSSGNYVSDANYSLTFAIYTVATAGTAAWSETQTVAVTNGAFSVNIGSTDANGVNLALDTPPYYLGVKVGANAEMAPRIQLGMAPFAMTAKNMSNVYEVDGNVGIGTTGPGYLLDVAHPTASSGYMAAFTRNSRTVGIYSGSAGGQIGTVTNHNLAFFTNNGSAQMTLNTNGNVGIGTSAPAGIFEVVGSSTGSSVDVTSGGTAWAGSTFAGLNVTSAFDNDMATYWGNNNSLTGNNGMVGYIFGTAQTINRVRFKPRTSSGWGGVNSFDVMYSDTGGVVANWTVIASGTHTNDEYWGDYTFTNTTQSHLYWAIRVNTSYAGSYTALWEFEMMVAGTVKSGLVVTSTGNVGIGTSTPGIYQLYVNGPAYSAYGWDSTSDIRLKQNINPITSALDTVSQLQGVTYEWRRNEFPERRMPDGNQYGLIAQEVEKIIPEIVTTNDDGYKAINYEKFIPFLIESVKDLDQRTKGIETTAAGNVIITNGSVGIGTTSPSTALQVVGTITGTTKNFEINHPTKPGMKLVHSTVEGPEVAVFYRGESKLVNGKMVVVLPEYFEALTRKEGRTVQLTAKNGWSPLYVDGEVINGRFTVKADSGKPDQQFYWEVKAVRADVAPLVVEKSVN